MLKPILCALVAATCIGRAEIFVVTAYCKCEMCCGKQACGITASGKKPRQGTTCAAPRHIPFGTAINIEGFGARIVEDRLALAYEGRIDIYFDDHAKAAAFGVKRLNVVFDSKYRFAAKGQRKKHHRR